MALASYFDKAALAAAHVLQGYDRTAFEARLLAAPVELAFDGAATRLPEAQATLDLAVRLLARLYPRLVLTPLDEVARDYVAILEAQAQAINTQLDLRPVPAVVSLVVGCTQLERPHPVFYLGSQNWLTRFSPVAPVGSGASLNPFGAGAAACLGAANVFRTVFADQLIGAEPDASLSLSLLDYSSNSADDPGPLLPERLAVGEATLVGLGAVGQGLVWALSRLSLQGTLHLVDGEAVELSNLQRYVLTEENSPGALKTQLAAATLGSSGAVVQQHPVTWQIFLAGQSTWHLPLVLVGVDSAADRIAIQGALPQRLLNAWTQTADLGVSRHLDFQQQACLTCLYRTTGLRPSESQTVAQALGLPQHERDIRELLYTNAPLDAMWLERIAQAKGLAPQKLLPFAGKPIRAFYSQQVCGSLLLGTSADRQTQTPLAFQSALAGLLLAAEFVVETQQLRPSPLPLLTRFNLLKPLAPFLNEAFQKTSGCICQDADYVEQYAQKYS